MITKQQIEKDQAIIEAYWKTTSEKGRGQLKKLMTMTEKALLLLNTGHGDDFLNKTIVDLKKKIKKFDSQIEIVKQSNFGKDYKRQQSKILKDYFDVDGAKNQIFFCEYMLVIKELTTHLMTAKV